MKWKILIAIIWVVAPLIVGIIGSKEIEKNTEQILSYKNRFGKVDLKIVENTSDCVNYCRGTLSARLRQCYNETWL